MTPRIRNNLSEQLSLQDTRNTPQNPAHSHAASCHMLQQYTALHFVSSYIVLLTFELVKIRAAFLA
jgi:hypothetical protein